MRWQIYYLYGCCLGYVMRGQIISTAVIWIMWWEICYPWVPVSSSVLDHSTRDSNLCTIPWFVCRGLFVCDHYMPGTCRQRLIKWLSLLTCSFWHCGWTSPVYQITSSFAMHVWHRFWQIHPIRPLECLCSILNGLDSIIPTHLQDAWNKMCQVFMFMS